MTLAGRAIRGHRVRGSANGEGGCSVSPANQHRDTEFALW